MPPLRIRVAALTFAAALLLPGCLAPATPGTPPAGPGGPALPPLPGDVPPFTHLLCAGDALEPLDAARSGKCNTKVTIENGPAAEVSLAVNPLDPLNLVGGAKDFTLGEDPNCGRYSVWSGVYWTRDGGRTWKNGLLPGHPKDERKTALSEYPCGSDPVLVFAPDGTLYYTSLMVAADPDDPPPHPMLAPVSGGQLKAAVAVTRSWDGGETWDEPVIVTSHDGNDVLDKQWIAVDPANGHVHLSYLGGEGLMTQRSEDRGATWSAPVTVVSPGSFLEGRNLIQFAQIAVGPGSLLHFVYFAVREDGAPAGIHHKASTDGGETWEGPHPVAVAVPPIDFGSTRKYRMVGMPDVAVDARNGALYVAYVSRNPSDADVLATASTDGGKTWSAPVRLTDDLPSPTNDQWMVALETGPDGVVHATWLDYRDDPAGQFAYVYYAHSKDGAKSWSRNVRVSDVPFDGTGGYHQSGSGTIGDYMGLAVSPRAVHPFWADTREGRNDVYAAIILAAG